MMIRKLAQHTAVYGISSIVARLLNWLLTPYLTNIMTPAEYGVITDIYALIPFALVLLTMGLETGYFRFAGQAKTPRRKQEIFSSTWAAVSYLGVAFFVVALLFNGPIARAMGYGERPELMLMAAAIIALDVISAIPFVRLREQGRARRFVVVRLLSVGINLALCFFLYGALPHIPALAAIYDPSFGAGYYLVANLAASVVTFIILIPKDTFRIFGRVNRRLLYRMFAYSLPLLLGGIAGTGTEFLDRQLIKFLIPEGDPMSQLGIYGAVLRIGVVMVLFTQMYRMAAEPFFLANVKKEDFVKVNAEAMKYYWIVTIAIFLGVTLFADIFSHFIGRDFREGMFILPLVLLFNMLAGVVLNLSFWYKQGGQTRYAILITGTGLVVTLLAGIALIPRLGYYGAALARVAAEVAMMGVSYYLNHKYSRTPYDLRRIGEYIVVGAALWAMGFFTVELPAIPKYLCNLALVAAFGVFAAWREKINVPALLKSMIKR